MTKFKSLLTSALFLGLAAQAAAAELIHNPVLVAAAGQDVQIQASLIGGNADARVRLFFRPKGKEIYRSMEMSGPVSDLVATLPGSAVDVAGIEYYLEAAKTVNGVKTVLATSPAANPTLNPHSVVVRKDESGPEIVVLSPLAGDSVDSTRPVITAAWSDPDSGVDLGSVLIKIDGEVVKDKGAIQAFDTLVSYLPSEDVANGEHEVTVVVKDKAGNAGAIKWKFTVKAGAEQVNKVKKSGWTVDGAASYETQYGATLSASNPAPGLPYRPYGVNRGTLDVNARGKDDTLNLKVYKTDEERSDQQPIDRYTASWRNRQGTIAVGDINPSFSELSLYGLNHLRGALFDLHSGPLNEGHTRMVGVWGQTQRAVEPGSTGFAGAPSAGAFAEYLYGARWEFGNPYFLLGMNTVTVNDDKDSITNSGGLSPHYNTLGSSDLRIGLPFIFLTLTGEAGSDFYAADTQPLGVALGSAYRAGADLNIRPWQTRLRFDFKDLGGSYGIAPGGYYNLSNPGLLTDYRGYESSFSQALFDSQFSLDLGLNHWRDNLQGQKLNTTATDFFSVNSNIAPNLWPYLSVGYSQNLQANDADGNTTTGNLIVNFKTSSLNLGLGYTRQLSDLDSGSLNVNWVGSNFTDQAPKHVSQDLASSNVVVAGLWAHRLSSFNASVGIGRTDQPGLNAGDTAQGLSIGAKTGNSLSAGLRWNQVWNQTAWTNYVSYDLFNSSEEDAALGAVPKSTLSSSRSTVTLGAGYKISEAQRLSGSIATALVNTKTDPGVEANLTELLGSLRYDVSF